MMLLCLAALQSCAQPTSVYECSWYHWDVDTQCGPGGGDPPMLYHVDSVCIRPGGDNKGNLTYRAQMDNDASINVSTLSISYYDMPEDCNEDPGRTSGRVAVNMTYLCPSDQFNTTGECHSDCTSDAMSEGSSQWACTSIKTCNGPKSSCCRRTPPCNPDLTLCCPGLTCALPGGGTGIGDWKCVASKE